MRQTVTKTIIDAVTRSNLIRPGMKILCAVSGGADSMCLLHVLFENREQFGISVAAAHYNHALRGEESERDCRFVSSFCRDREIPFYTETGDVEAYAEAHSLGIEEAARVLRYAFLNRAAESAGCSVIATAHNLEDNAETVLFHLLRGGGAEGLAGIPPARENLIRPLLAVSRRTIEAYLAENEIPYVTDSTNLSDAYTRNRIRHQVMPVLISMNPRFGEAVLRSGELLRQDDECLTVWADAFIEQFYDGFSLPVKELLALHQAISSRVIRRLSPKPLTKMHVDAVLGALRSTERTFVDLPGARILVEQGRITWQEETPPAIFDIELIPGETVELPESGLRIETKISVYPEKVNGLFKPFCFKCDQIYGRVFLTARRAGDEIRLRGRGCTKSVRKLFMEAGLTNRERLLTPVLRDDRGVLAVYGFGESERGAPQAGDCILQISIVPVNSLYSVIPNDD